MVLKIEYCGRRFEPRKLAMVLRGGLAILAAFLMLTPRASAVCIAADRGAKEYRLMEYHVSSQGMKLVVMAKSPPTALSNVLENQVRGGLEEGSANCGDPDSVLQEAHPQQLEAIQDGDSHEMDLFFLGVITLMISIFVIYLLKRGRVNIEVNINIQRGRANPPLAVGAPPMVAARVLPRDEPIAVPVPAFRQ